MTAPIQQLLLMTGAGAYVPLPGSWLVQLDASLLSSVTIGGGNAVTAWADATGNGVILDDSSGGGTPVYSATGGANSKPTLTFSSGARLTKSSFAMGTSNELTVAWVGSMNAATDAYGMPIVYTGGGNHANTGAWYFSRESTNAQFRFNRNASALNASMVYDTTYRVIMTIDSSGSMTLYVNGVATTGATAAGNWISGAALTLGELLTNPGLRRFVGTCSFVGVSDVFRNSTGVATLDAILQAKW